MQIIELNYINNFKSIIKLWEEAFDRSLSEAQAEWFFCGPEKNLIYAAISDNGEIVGIYCMLEHVMSTPFGRTICYLCNNVCSHPKHRDQNIFVKLGRYVIQKNMKLSALSIGFPNDKAYPGHKRVGWNLHRPLTIYESRTSSISANICKYTFNLISDPCIINLRNDNFLNSENSFYIIKDSSYIRWRYFNRPINNRSYYVFSVNFEMKSVGYIVISARADTGYAHIIDLACQDLEANVATLSFAKEFAYNLNLKFINILGSPHLIMPAQISGFQPSNNLINLISNNYSSGSNFHLLNHHQNLNLVFGDNDVY